jgi:hypothetical protein
MKTEGGWGNMYHPSLEVIIPIYPPSPLSFDGLRTGSLVKEEGIFTNEILRFAGISYKGLVISTWRKIDDLDLYPHHRGLRGGLII